MSAARPLSHNDATGPCAVCGKSGLPCARCRVHYYCSKEHQKEHWPQHKPGCGSIGLVNGVVVATKCIPAGTVIMREVPTLTFPSSPWTYHALKIKWMCSACYANMTWMKSAYQCTRCGLPVCDDQCSQSTNHQVECQIMQRAKYKVSEVDLRGPQNFFFGAVVATLRIAAAFRGNPLLQHLDREWNFEIEGYKRVPSATSMIRGNHKACSTVASLLRRTVKEFSEDDLKRAARISFMYGEEMEGPSPERFIGVTKQRYGRHLYLGMQLRKHSCYPNTGDRCMAPETAEHVVVTTRNISAGECITKNHQGVDWLDETMQRRTLIFTRWGFVCDCERCSDPTEMGMYVGSPCCVVCARKGRQSYLVPVVKDHSQWRCEGCNKKMTEAQVQCLTLDVEKKMDKLHGSPPDKLLKFIASQLHPRGPLHPTHGLVLRAKDYIRAYIYENRADEYASESEIDTWEVVIRDLLRAMDRLLPGTSEARIMALLELRRLVLGRVRLYCSDILLTALGDFKDVCPEIMDPSFWKDREAVLEVNKELCRYHFNRDEDEPKRSLINDPFGGR
ncbi:SET domain-containing protein SmydA-8-like [Thrips palmi]|uniref:SET domain-containing protein SmydA-8-like n=1 Tax=Thrips palmi TaxID=161013 RepID=A0A6P8ZQJ3_THRPL|nr:SET domain-containing protein SmydA-8-like [Thrips palmi]XP_034245954.1 SET domain-containing protein SmydA-8-like [Thrips palmi]XP_034245955.1 SET domain-containing protein SmydA-8-like [Thrips palmi]XP_034245956.1 SET domain-containing protein SmydA-8-like [Thrips palmi]XP_034245957.1 SET domain-containing protein SmydA-8-like [Thrips palmi]